MSVSHHPPVLWAQRKDKLFVTIDVQDCVNPKLKLEKRDESADSAVLKFSGIVGDGSSVDVLLELHGDVNAAEAKVSVTGRHVLVVVPKKAEGFWPRLTKDKQPRFVSVDWSKWVDEDEEDEAPEFDLSSMGQFGGLDQFDSDDDEDEEDEPPPETTQDKPKPATETTQPQPNPSETEMQKPDTKDPEPAKQESGECEKKGCETCHEKTGET